MAAPSNIPYLCVMQRLTTLLLLAGITFTSQAQTDCGLPHDITLNQCINEKLADGWYAFSGFPVSRDKQGSHFYGSNVGYEALTHASFWRWAE